MSANFFPLGDAARLHLMGLIVGALVFGYLTDRLGRKKLSSHHRLVELLGIRDAMMADNPGHIVARERGRGKVLAFAHNSHLKRGQAQWQWGPHALAWWPAGSHLQEMFGPRYASIGSAIGVSDANGIGQP